MPGLTEKTRATNLGVGGSFVDIRKVLALESQLCHKTGFASLAPMISLNGAAELQQHSCNEKCVIPPISKTNSRKRDCQPSQLSKLYSVILISLLLEKIVADLKTDQLMSQHELSDRTHLLPCSTVVLFYSTVCCNF